MEFGPVWSMEVKVVIGCEAGEGARADLRKPPWQGWAWPYTGAMDGLQGPGRTWSVLLFKLRVWSPGRSVQDTFGIKGT